MLSHSTDSQQSTINNQLSTVSWRAKRLQIAAFSINSARCEGFDASDEGEQAQKG
jgi:hypothetical protein